MEPWKIFWYQNTMILDQTYESNIRACNKKGGAIKTPPLINAQYEPRKKEQGMGLGIYLDHNASNKILRRFKIELLTGN